MLPKITPTRHLRCLLPFVPVSIFIVLISVASTAALPTEPGHRPPRSIALSKPTAVTPTLFLVPDAVAPNGDIILIGYGLTPSGTFVVSASGGRGSYQLGRIVSDANGNAQTTLTMPGSMVPGVYWVTLDDPSVISATLTIMPPMALTLSPVLGSPGTIVTFTVNNLTPGNLRLDYAGVPIWGPAPVSSAALTATFIVPSDRPAPISSTTIVTAINLAGNQAIGRSTIPFRPLNPISPTIFSIVNLASTVPNAAGGELITITGQISPASTLVRQSGAVPSEDSAVLNFPFTASDLKLMWQTPNSQIFPLTPLSATVSSSGSFKFIGSLPSLFNGDPASSMPGANSLGVGLSNGQTNVAPNYLIVGIKNPAKLRFRVVNTASQPIANAVVGLDYKSLLAQASVPPPTYGIPSGNFEANGANQVAKYLGGQMPGDQDPFSCASTNIYGQTDASGYFTPTLDWDEILGALGQTIPITIQGQVKTGYLHTPITTTFYFYVNAQWQGYGSILNGAPQVYTRTLVYSKAANSFFDPITQHSINADPITVTLPKLPDGVQADIPIVYHVDGVQKTIPWLFGGTVTAYGTYLSFQKILSQGIPVLASPLKISFDHDPNQYGNLFDVRFYVDGQDKGSFSATSSGKAGCAAGAITYYFDWDGAHQLAPGLHIAQIGAHASGGFVTTKTFLLEFKDAPQWILDPSLSDQQAGWDASSYGGFTLKATHMPQDAPSNTSSLSADVPRVGPLTNLAGGHGSLTNNIKTSGDSKMVNSGGVDVTALNNHALPPSTDKSVIANNPIQIPKTTTQILNTGWIPILKDVWGIPPIAAATFTLKIAFNAMLTYSGLIQFQPFRNILFVDPEATVKVDANLDASVLFDIIDAGADAVPKITVSLPMTVTNGTVSASAKCFRYKLDIDWYYKIGYCPLCKKGGGTKNIFDGRTPDSDVCKKVALQSTIKQLLVTSDVTTSPPSGINPAIATDGFGHTLAVWSDDNNNLQYSEYNGATWLTPQYLLANAASLHPGVTYYAPNQAVAVWAQTDLTGQQLISATLTDTVRSLHLAYSIWNGSSWSVPQNLTSPSTGDGSVTLVACLSTKATCPSGGAVTAVWVHDEIGDLAARQFRLYYATYQNGSWNMPQPVDRTSTATDDEPTAVYSGTYPLVVWVRDADRDLGTLDDRRITYRYLNGSDPVVTATDLPTGTLEPSAAIDANGQLKVAFTVPDEAGGLVGNQHDLYSAAQTCAGSCTWSVQRLKDIYLRPIHAERPILTLKPDGSGIITFRGMGFGQSTELVQQPLPDPIGMTWLTGEAAQVQVDFATEFHSLSYLSNDGAVNWHTAAVFDPLQLQTHVISVKGTAPILSTQLAAQSTSNQVRLAPHKTQTFANSPSLVFYDVPHVADLIFADVSPSSRFPTTTESVYVDGYVGNVGPITSNEQSPIEVVATWDDVLGVGTFAGSAEINPLAPDQYDYFEIPLSRTVDLTMPHTLYVTVNPTQTTPEIDVANDIFTATIGGLPFPTDVDAYGQQGSPIVYLQWTPIVTDTRIAGYRIYRSTNGGLPAPIGSTFVGGYADVTADPDHTYQYFVTAYNAEGIESDFSPSLEVTTQSFRIDLPLIVKNY